MKHKTKLRLPIEGQWFVFWGGDTEELNYHRSSRTQRHALDLLIVDKQGNTYSGKGDANTDYHAFGSPIIAPADGNVVEAVDGMLDNKPGLTNPGMPAGNYILIKHCDGEFSKLCHFKLGSVAVNTGDLVKAGQKLGECGNSGNTSQPHLHYHLQDSEVHARFVNGDIEWLAKGVKAYFSDIEVRTKENTEVKFVHSPIKGEVVENADK